ncbi:MAG: Uridine kinase [Bacteroidetes bacterium ADurb.Bin012]|jgi:uridine kinase|nr:MAG: Uridine kinase [Bacteroidetes bacterium ADurb.Bin012]
MLTIGIAGGSGSGKTTVVKKITQLLPPDSVSVLSQDAYYYDNSHLPPDERVKINFDHPSSIEFPLLNRHIDLLMEGERIPHAYIQLSYL